MSHSSTSRVLLLMTTSTYRAHAFLEAAERLGVPVTVGSERRQALSAANPSGHLVLDFLDLESSTSAIVDLHRREPIAAIVAADDDGAVLAAHAAQSAGLRYASPESVGAARDKLAMRERLAGCGVASPGWIDVGLESDPAGVAREVAYPCVLKPRFLSGSRGVIRADDPEAFVDAFRRIRRILRIPAVADLGGAMAGSILVEDFVPGVEVAVEGLVTDGRLKVLAVYDKPDPLDGPYFEETLYVTPSRHGREVLDGVTVTVREALAGLGLEHGPVHAEIRINDRGAWIVEIAPRSIGGLCGRTLRFGDGLSLEEVILRHALGWSMEGLERDPRAAGVLMIPVPAAGVLRAVEGVDDARAVPGIEDLRISIPTGHAVAPPPDGNRYLGFVFSRTDTSAAAETALREAHARLSFTIDPTNDPRHG